MNTGAITQRIHRLFQNTDKFYSLSDTALTSIFRLISSIVLAKIAGAEVFAHYVLVTSVIVILQSLSQSYFTTPVIHVAGLSRKKIENLYCWSASRLQKTQVVLVVLLAILLISLWFFQINLLDLSGFAAASLVLLSSQHFKAYRQTRFENKRLFWANICGIFVHISIFVTGLIYEMDALSLYGWGLFINYLLVYLICRPESGVRLLSSDTVIDEDNVSSLTKNGKYMALGSLTGIFSSRLQPFMLASFASTLDVAQFGAVMTIAGPIRMSSMFLQNVLRPRLSLFHNQGDQHAFRSILQKSILFLFIMGSIGVLISLLVEQWLLALCFNLTESIPVGILAIAVIYATIDSITTCQMVALQVGHKNGTLITTKLRFASAVVSMISIIPLCIYWGSIGAVFSLLIGEIVYLIFAKVYEKV